MPKHIAIYLTDTWRTEQSAAFINYAQKFENLLGPHMPDTVFEHFDVVEGHFPSDPTSFDGIVITGSAAYVTDSDPWISTLFEHIRIIDNAKTKLFAVCFGHQAVAMALGGKVEFRDVVLGAPKLNVLEPRDWMIPPFEDPRIYAGNFQQVIELPDSMQLIGSHPDCLNALAEKGRHILSIQFHPELSAAYMLNYLACAEEDLSPEQIERATHEINSGSNGDIVGQWAAAFLLGS